MPFVPNFTVSQSSADITVATITDASSGSDLTLTTRLVYIQKVNGDYLVPEGTTTDFVAWPIAQSSINIDILDQDYALDITVKYLSGSTISYTKNILCLFTGYGDLFLRQLTQALAANKVLLQDENFWVNKNNLRVLLDDAAQGVSLLNDQTIAQLCLDESKLLTDNIKVFF